MHPVTHARLNYRKGATVSLLAMGLLLAGCQDQPADATAAAPTTAPTPPQTQPTPVPAAVPASPAPAAVPAPASTAPKTVPLSVQGVASAGVTVRVKAVEIGADATVLDVSISFSNRLTDSTMLAMADTFIEAENGGRLHIKRPDDNRDLTIRQGETLDGKLVFMGAVSPSASKLRLVFNEGNQTDNIVAPGLVMELPLQGG